MNKNFIFYIHSVAGLVVGVFILLMSFSGAALVFHEQIDDIQIPSVTANENKMLTVDDCYSLVQKQYPAAQVSHCVLPDNNSKCLSFFIYDSSYKKGTRTMQVFLHPQTGDILKTRGGSDDVANNFMSWLSAFHNSFHLGKTGEWLLGSFSIIFLVSIITGLILFRKNIGAVLLFKKGVYRKNNLHQLIGVYALLFNLMIGITGFWMQRYVFKKEFYAASTYTPVLKTSPPLFFKFDSAYSALQKKHPGFAGAVIYFAQSKKGMTTIYGSRSSNAYIHSKKYADLILLDSTGNLAGTRFINEIDASDRYDIINSQLHMGKFGGAGIKIIYFLFGLAGGFLSITGFLLWIKRK
ncbi:MAG TPA: PepSY-associated TM helix domain-containing protein [Ferruginibacter sp.]|nr:PepSY-associated TM helix domain-containing protein [Ferruginibacter sp.]